VRAYSEAIKAVESAAHSVIQPRNTKATLGTMLGELRTARHKFGTALVTAAGKDPILPVEEMMRALWEGQTSRHGAQTATVPETLDASRAATRLAAPGPAVRLGRCNTESLIPAGQPSTPFAATTRSLGQVLPGFLVVPVPPQTTFALMTATLPG
jgi:hypothetical protein